MDAQQTTAPVTMSLDEYEASAEGQAQITAMDADTSGPLLVEGNWCNLASGACSSTSSTSVYLSQCSADGSDCDAIMCDDAVIGYSLSGETAAAYCLSDYKMNGAVDTCVCPVATDDDAAADDAAADDAAESV